jgi:hypothetical protein
LLYLHTDKSTSTQTSPRIPQAQQDIKIHSHPLSITHALLHSHALARAHTHTHTHTHARARTSSVSCTHSYPESYVNTITHKNNQKVKHKNVVQSLTQSLWL